MTVSSGDHAVVLTVTSYRESDQLARIFTLTHGIIPVIARGAKVSRKRFSGAVEPCALLSASIQIRPSGISTLHDAVRIGHGMRLRSSPECFALACYFCELVLSFLPEHLPNRRLFRLLWHLLDHLGGETELHLPSLKCFAEINLLNITGYRPHMESLSLPDEVRRKLLFSLSTSRVGSVRFLPEEIEVTAPFLESEISRHLDRPLRTREFLALFAETVLAKPAPHGIIEDD